MTTQANPTHPDDLSCAQCGALDIRAYDGEIPLCPHCGAVLDPTPPTPPTWLSQWPAPKRSSLAQLFYSAVRSGVTDPATIVGHVQAALYRRLQWTTDFDQRQCWCQVLNTIADDPGAVDVYAATVVEREQLPPDKREALKRERAKAFVLEAMRGKPVTEKQLWLLRSKGYGGPLPTNRAEASELIDALLRQAGGAHA